ncbi:vWA domain-containing protein [Planctomicrobium piriforme]|uniref:Ca-activated chloride channel family protein n=1 Tax=Planctomicrobium piriforme TaxID=1576369 RepID=A0A1I3JWL5_9PLAN|nr:VWA domain-containing protein [Planctomicrobium piriforme]SFI64556.1 Ca-activated chloride channel family protein [Planctomicrobium piriforme]
MVMLPVSLAVAVCVLATLAEMVHQRRVQRVSGLVFGPHRGLSVAARLAPVLRVVSLTAVTWGLTVLILLPPKAHGLVELPKEQRQNLIIALDVSPSMRAVDAGQKHDISRMRRAAEAIESIFSRSTMEGMTVSVVAFYTKAKPVVVQSTDMEVIRHVTNDLPLHYMFDSGKTNILAGIETSAQLAKNWPLNSTTLLVITDGDTVPSTELPLFPPSIKDLLLIGVGDPNNGTRVNSELTRQNVDALRQVAMRYQGNYHNANEQNLPTTLLNDLAISSRRSKRSQFSMKDWALLCVGAGSLMSAAVPLGLALFGTRWRPGTTDVARTAVKRTSERYSLKNVAS